MVAKHSLQTVCVTALTMLAIAGTNFGAAGMLRPNCSAMTAPRAGAPKASAPCAKACCCGAQSLPRACGCERDQESPKLPAPTSNDSGRTLKWAPWVAVLPALGASGAPGHEMRARDRDFSTPPQRSRQSLLCIWRI